MTPSWLEDLATGDPVDLARALLGMRLVHHHPTRGPLEGIIVETEAYRGEEDLACHARAGRTERTEVMYGPAGRAYVYLIYGMYEMLNVTAWPTDQPAAVLIRALEPITPGLQATNGPGRLTRAMGIDRSLNGHSLDHAPLQLLAGDPVMDHAVSTGPRVGVDYAGAWALRPWRFWVAGNRWVSRAPSRPRRHQKTAPLG